MTKAEKMTAQRPDMRPGIPHVLIVAPPLIGFFAAFPLGLFWVMGASAFSGTDKSWVFNLSFWIIVAYIVVYSALMLCVGLLTMLKWRKLGVLHGLIWLSFIVFVITIVWSVSVMSAPG